MDLPGRYSLAVCCRNTCRSGEIIEAILSARETFAGTIAPADDMTLVVAKIEQTAGRRLVKSPQDRKTAATCRDTVDRRDHLTVSRRIARASRIPPSTN